MSQKNSGIKFGDPRIFFESTTTAPFVSPAGVYHDAGAVVRGSAIIQLSGQSVAVSLPSMAEMIFFQANKDLDKAASIKERAQKIALHPNGSYHLVYEDVFYRYLQLCSLGILGLHASIEGMVYELYIRKGKEHEVKIDGKTLSFTEFTNLGFERKITSVAAQLSNKSNIYGTDLLAKAREIKRLRGIVQHWDVERREDYFINLPDNHPLKESTRFDPSKLARDCRLILDHYSLRQ